MNENKLEILPEYPEVLSAKMVANILGMGYINTLKLIKYGDIRYIKIGNVYKVPKRGLIEWLNSSTSKVINLGD